MASAPARVSLGERRRRRYLEVMGIPVWQVRGATPGPVPEPMAEPAVEVSWEGLAGSVAGCTRCGLHAGRTHTVFGVGDHHADWMIIGEAPGAEEDRRGEPFVGRAGQLLNAMLKAIGLDREQVYIANVVKCRPPDNRDPRPEEAACCESYLVSQMRLLQPKIILAVGRVAAQNLLQTDISVGRLRGHVHRYPASGIPLVVTYHPAYLLRSPREKAKAWEDLKLARGVLRGSAHTE